MTRLAASSTASVIASDAAPVRAICSAVNLSERLSGRHVLAERRGLAPHVPAVWLDHAVFLAAIGLPDE